MAKGGMRGKVRFTGRAGKGTRKRMAGYNPKLRGQSRRASKSARVPYGRRPTTLRKAGSNGLIKSVNGSLTNTYTSYYSKPSRLVGLTKAITAAQQYTYNEGLRYDGKFGFQLPFSIGAVNLQPELVKIAELVNEQNGINVNPPTPNYLPTQFIIEDVLCNFTMANASTAPVELSIYDITVRRDVAANFSIGNFGAAYRFNSGADPASVWSNGSWWQNGQSFPIPPGTPLPSDYLGASPYDCQLWKDMFKVNKVQRVLLSAGGVHRHTVNYKLNKLIDTSLLGIMPGNGVTNMYYFGGWTKVVMIVAKGLPVSASENSSQVTTSDPHIDVVNDYRYRYSFVTNNVSKTTNGDRLTTPATCRIVTPANAQVITVSQT